MGTELTSTTDVIDRLGGNIVVAALTDRTPKAVSNWRAFNAFPPDTFIVLISALSQQGCTAPNSLWRMVEPRVAS